jgi:hypothetical protein
MESFFLYILSNPLFSLGLTSHFCLHQPSANAFQMSGRPALKSTLRMADEMVGASIEVNGGKVYDPLGLLDIHEINPGYGNYIA